jgi:hypothetical protein
MKQCEKGHFYDEGRYLACPYCQNAGQPFGKTVAAVQGVAGANVGKTMPVQDMPNPVARGKTVAVISKDIGIDPAVGFLVCVEGPQKGKDFRLTSGRNFIGRSNDMDVAISEDDTVSRENHAVVSHDVKNNNFTIAPGQGRGITYLNNEEVANAKALAAYD